MRSMFKCLALLFSVTLLFSPQTFAKRTSDHAISDMLLTEITTPKQLDELWKAFYSSKDLRLVDKIFQTYASIANDPLIDENDIFLLTYALSIPKNRVKNHATLTSLPNKYKNTNSISKLVTASCALWSLARNAEQYILVNQQIQKYLLNVRNKKIITPLKKTLIYRDLA